jgi:hypothetical protein
MNDVWLLETVVFIFLLLPLMRPFFTVLRQFTGLVFLHPLGLAITAGLFPAYGFRPECIPLLICAVALNIKTFFIHITGRDVAMLASVYTRKRTSSPAATIVIIVILVIVTGIAAYFSPALDTRLVTDNVRTVSLFDERRRIPFSVRIYETEGEERNGLMLVIPPLIDSVRAVDNICAEIRKNGFTAAVFSREKLPLKERLALCTALIHATVLEKANQTGRYWEQERLADIDFIFSRMDDVIQGGKQTPVFAVGYGAGGSALISAISSQAFIAAHPSLKAVVAVESRLWSLFYHEDEPPEDIPEDIPWFKNMRLKASAWLESRRPKKVNRYADAPVMQKPALFLTPDTIIRAKERDGIYAALLLTMHASDAAPALLIAGQGMRLPDYTDYPATRPLYSAVCMGAGRRIRMRRLCVVNTAKCIAGFASLFMDETAKEENGFQTGMGGAVYIEKNQAWNSGGFGVY